MGEIRWIAAIKRAQEAKGSLMVLLQRKIQESERRSLVGRRKPTNG